MTVNSNHVLKLDIPEVQGLLFSGDTLRSRVMCWFPPDIPSIIQVHPQDQRTLRVLTESDLKIRLEGGRWIAVECINRGDILRYVDIRPSARSSRQQFA